jgi:hypothetical protein
MMKMLIKRTLGIVCFIGAWFFTVWVWSSIIFPPAQRSCFAEPHQWQYIPDSNKVSYSMAQRFVMLYSQKAPSGIVTVDTVLYILEFDFDVATLDTDKYPNYATGKNDYRPPELFIKPLDLRMSQGLIVNRSQKSWLEERNETTDK